MIRLLKIIVFFGICSFAATAAAHQSSVSYVELLIEDTGAVRATLRLSSRDLYEALGLDRDRDAEDAEIRAGEQRLHDYVLARMELRGDGRPCPITSRALDIVTQANRFAELRYTAACPLPLSTVSLDYRLFFDLDSRHVGMLRATHRGQSLEQELSRGFGHFEWRLSLAAPAGLGPADYVVKGMEHIYTGYDHIAFVIALLLVAVVGRRLRPATRYVLKIVTAFTVAHSVTLILAALEIITLKTRFVESAIAASIVYVAVENIVVAAPAGRWPLAFVFGLVHGLGFASVLRPLLPPTDIIAPLLLFNVGVELGQLSILLVLMPLLALFAARDPARYRRWVVLGGSSLIALLGTLWLVERVLDLRLVSWFF